MAIHGIKQPEYIEIDSTLRLRKWSEPCDFALPWYQDEETLLLVDGANQPYDMEKLMRMYRYLETQGEEYFIEARAWADDAFVPIGDVTFWQDDMPIVIGEKTWRGKGVGKKVVQALVGRAKVLGFTYLGVEEIYSYNTVSRRLFESIGFCESGETQKGHSYRLELTGTKLDVTKLSDRYAVRFLTLADVDVIYQLSVGNPLFYQYCPPFITKTCILEDMQALPPGKCYKDKYYIGFFDAQKLVAVMDLILDHPDAATAFIGLFMMERAEQGCGKGTAIISACLAQLKAIGYTHVRLGYAKGNPQSEAFWLKNGFIKTGVESDRGAYTVVVMQRDLR